MGNCGSNTSTSTSTITFSKKQPSKENKNSGTRRSHELESKKVVSESGHEARGANPSPKSVEDFRRMASYSNANSFTYDELRRAGGNFRSDQVIGRGGFGVVYKGVLDDDVRQGLQHTPVAIKVLDQDGSQGDREWLAEVNHLGQVVHQNLVKLIGYCCEEDHRLLVYEYMASGSLEKHLFRRVSLTMPWPTRIKIAFDAAKGLAFLHGAERPVIYRDFKPSNILLDEDFNAKLSDFGLAKEGPVGDQTHVTTRVMGTQGYAAPEYIMTGHLTSRSDVYGFGVVLLEILLGRSTATGKCRSSRGHNLVEGVRPLLIHDKKLLKIVDPRIEGQYTIKTLKKAAKLAYSCLDQNPRGRPTMSQVVEMLEAIRNLSECRGGSVSHRGDGIITLYEVPQVAWDRTTKEGNCSSKVEDDTEPKVENCRRKASKAQSRSGRLPIEYGGQSARE